MDQEKIVEQLKVKDKWLRALFMIFFIIALSFIQTVVLLIVAFQFVHVLFTGEKNQHVRPFSQNILTYITHIYAFITYESETKPYPFGPWNKKKLK